MRQNGMRNQRPFALERVPLTPDLGGQLAPEYPDICNAVKMSCHCPTWKDIYVCSLSSLFLKWFVAFVRDPSAEDFSRKKR
jgi:hypothetical protein